MAVVSIKTENFVRTITMDRPDALNAFNADMMHDLCEAFLGATHDNDVRVVILTGAGRAFSSGADLKSMGAKPKPGQKDFNAMLDAILEFPKPLIIAINGLGVGIGATICGLGDITIMSEDARLKTPFSALGLTAEAGSTYTFPAMMGHQKASWMLLSGDWISADACLESGLVLEVCASDQLMETAHARASQLAALPPTSLAMTKSLLRAPHLEAIRQSVTLENKGLASLSGGPANKEAITAFIEKREPDFSKL